MAEYMSLMENAMNDFEGNLTSTIQNRDENFELESDSTIKIQSHYRGMMEMRRFTTIRNACELIQRIFRGYMGRVYVDQLFEEVYAMEQIAILEFCAAQIQRTLRGFHSRKYVHDFYARKAYIQSVMERGNEVRDISKAHREQQIQNRKEREINEAQEEFRDVASKLHYLVSTSARPGIYNTPHAKHGSPKAFGDPVEARIRRHFREQLIELGATQQAPRSTLPRIKRSVQADSKYDVCDIVRKKEKRLQKLGRVADRDFITVGRVKEKPFSSVHIGNQYIESHKIMESERSKFKGPIPFHVAVKKDKLFDEIADEKEGNLKDMLSNQVETERLPVISN